MPGGEPEMTEIRGAVLIADDARAFDAARPGANDDDAPPFDDRGIPRGVHRAIAEHVSKRRPEGAANPPLLSLPGCSEIDELRIVALRS